MPTVELTRVTSPDPYPEGRQIAIAVAAALDDLEMAVRMRALSAGLPWDFLEHTHPLSDEVRDRLRAIFEPVVERLTAVMASINRSSGPPGSWPVPASRSSGTSTAPRQGK